MGLGHRKKAVIIQRADHGGFLKLLLDLGENIDSCLLQLALPVSFLPA